MSTNLTAFTRSLLALQAEGRTGFLSVIGWRDSVRIAMCLRNGDVVFATEGGAVGRRLLQSGLLSQALYERIAARMTTHHDAHHHHPKSTFFELQRSLEFCQRAVELGILTQRSIDKALDDESVAAVKRAFACTIDGSGTCAAGAGAGAGARASVEWSFEPIDSMTTLDTKRVLENTRRHAAPVNVQACLHDVVSQLPSTQKAEALRALIHTDLPTLTIASFSTSTPPSPTAGSSKRPLVRRPSPPPSRYATLRIPPANATTPTTPTTPPTPPTATTATTATTPTTPTTTTNRTAATTHPPPSPHVSGFYPSTKSLAPSSPEAMILGERVLQTAVEHVMAARWSLAEPELARAAQLLPNSHKVHLYQKWTKIQLRPDRLPTRAERHDLARTASEALQKDVGFAFGYYVAGDIALNEGDIPQAHRLLSRAVKLDPNLLDAHRLLRIAERRTAARAK